VIVIIVKAVDAD